MSVTKSDETCVEYPVEWVESIKKCLPNKNYNWLAIRAFIRAHFNYNNVDLANTLGIHRGTVSKIKKEIEREV